MSTRTTVEIDRGKLGRECPLCKGKGGWRSTITAEIVRCGRCQGTGHLTIQHQHSEESGDGR